MKLCVLRRVNYELKMSDNAQNYALLVEICANSFKN